MIELYKALCEVVHDAKGMDSAVNAMELYLVEHKDGKAKDLFAAVGEWKEDHVEKLASVLGYIKPRVIGSVELMAKAEQAQRTNRRLRNKNTSLSALYHHNASFHPNCLDEVEEADRIIPVLERVLTHELIRDPEGVFLMSDNGHTVMDFLNGHGVRPKNYSAAGFTKVDVFTPMGANDTLIWDMEPVLPGIDKKWAGFGVMKQLLASPIVRPGTVVLRVDLRQMPLQGVESSDWMTGVNACLAGGGYKHFVLLKAGRFHTPIIHVIMTVKKETRGAWASSLDKYLLPFAVNVFTISDYCERLIQRSYEFAIRPNITAEIIAAVGPSNYSKMFITAPGPQRTMLTKPRAEEIDYAATQSENVQQGDIDIE